MQEKGCFARFLLAERESLPALSRRNEERINMRYAFSGKPELLDSNGYDVLIVGTGIAGLYAALMLQEDVSCCIITKENVEISNSYLAQGGIAAAISKEDAPELHLEDTLVAGAGICDEDAVRVLVEEGPKDVMNLVSLGVPFDLNDDGDLAITREGGHHMNRIVHAGGDATGRETVKSLARLVAKRQNVIFLTHSFFVDILTDENGGTVRRAVNNENGVVLFDAITYTEAGIYRYTLQEVDDDKTGFSYDTAVYEAVRRHCKSAWRCWR